MHKIGIGAIFWTLHDVYGRFHNVTRPIQLKLSQVIFVGEAPKLVLNICLPNNLVQPLIVEILDVEIVVISDLVWLHTSPNGLYSKSLQQFQLKNPRKDR